MKNNKLLIVNIDDLKGVDILKNLYSISSITDLVQSYRMLGQLKPIHITPKYEVIDGYLRIEAIKRAGDNTVWAIIKDCQDLMYSRIVLNKTKVKPISDQIREIKTLFSCIPKKQGMKNMSGVTYKRHELLSAALDNNFKGDKQIKKLEVISEHPEGDHLLGGILSHGFKVDPCHEFIKKSYQIDITNNYGFTERLKRNEISISEANKLINDRHELNQGYTSSFIIPGKAYAYNTNCVDIAKIEEHKNSIDLLFTSPPFFLLKQYENALSLGHEKSKIEYCSNIARLLKTLLVTLKESANVIINIGETYDNGLGYGIVFCLHRCIEEITGLTFKDLMVWSKPNPKPQNESVKRTINNVEYLLWFVVDPKKAKYKMLTYTVDGREPKLSKGVKDVDNKGILWEKQKSISKPYRKIYTHLKEQDIANIIQCSVGKNHDVYKIYKEGHPAIMSALLPVVPILMTTDVGDRVLDPFGGSNVVGRITCLLNRIAVSTEISKQYFNIGCKMLEKSVADFSQSDLDVITKSFINNDINNHPLKTAA